MESNGMNLPKQQPSKLSTCLTMLFLAIGTTFLALLFLKLLGLSEMLPPTNSYLLASTLALIIGLLRHESLTKPSDTTFRRFLKGAGIFMMILPLFDIGALYMIIEQVHSASTASHNLGEYLTLYMLILIYSTIFFAIWLAPVAGLLFISSQKMLDGMLGAPSKLSTEEFQRDF
jgi:NADH:ubiquinone oxidoreductase subunit 3 (subunit A)